MSFFGDLFDAYMQRRGYLKKGQRPLFFEAEAETGQWRVVGDWNRRADEALAMKTSWVYSDINVIARECSQAGLNVLRLRGEELEEIKNHPFEVLMRRPNPFMSRSFMMQYTIGWMKLDGNAYWLLIPGVDGLEELWPLPADKMDPMPSKNRQKYLDGFVYRARGKKWTIEPEYVVHFRQWNYQDLYRGMSDIQAMRLAIKGDQAMQTWNYNFFYEKNAIPTTVVSLPQETSPSDFELLKEEIIKELAAVKRRTAVTRAGDMKVDTIGLSQRDLDYLEGREFTREEIDRIYGIPAGLWAKDATRANALAADKTFKDKTIWPLLVYISEEITAQVLWRYYGSEFIAQFDDVRPEDRTLRVAEAKTYGPAQTVNEFRAEYLKAPPLEDERGQMLVADLMKGPAMAIAPAPLKSVGGNGELKADLKRWKSVALRQFRQGNDPADYDFHSEAIPEALKMAIVGALKGAESEEEVRAAFKAADPFRGESNPFDRVRRPWEKKVVSALLQLWRKEAKRFLEHFRPEAAMEPHLTKALREKVVEDEIFWEEHVRVQVQVMMPLLEEAMFNGGQVAMELLETGLGLGIDWALVNPHALRWAREYAGELIKEITPTIRKSLGEAIANWIEAGEPLPKLTKRVEAIFEDAERAELIATTEATNTFTAANRLVWKESGVVDEYEWRTARDETVCPMCKPLHKQRRSAKEESTYVVPSGKFEGKEIDGPGSSAHPRCRCWEAPVVGED